MRFTDRVAVVTGAARGIGRASALRLAQEGADVAVVDIRGDQVRDTAAEIEKLGRRAVYFEMDVSQSAAVADMVRSVHNSFGQIDILVNSAAICPARPMVETSEEEWDRIIDVNLKGTYLCCKAAVPLMMERRYGKIVNFYSSGAKYGSPNSTAYAATKFGVWGFSLSLAVELGSYGINVNCVSPGVTATNMIMDVFAAKAAMAGKSLESALEDVNKQLPLGRMAQPEELAAGVAFLASSDADYITGHVLQVDGANNRLRF